MTGDTPRRARVDIGLLILAGVVAASTWDAVTWRWEFASFYLVAAFLLQLVLPKHTRIQTWVLAGSAPILVGILYPRSWSTVAGAAHLTALAVGALISGFWLAEYFRRQRQPSHAV